MPRRSARRKAKPRNKGGRCGMAALGTIASASAPKSQSVIGILVGSHYMMPLAGMPPLSAGGALLLEQTSRHPANVRTATPMAGSRPQRLFPLAHDVERPEGQPRPE